MVLGFYEPSCRLVKRGLLENELWFESMLDSVLPALEHSLAGSFNDVGDTDGALANC